MTKPMTPSLTSEDFSPGDRVRILGIVFSQGVVIRIKDGFVEVQPDGYTEAEPFDAFQLVKIHAT